MLWVCPSFSDQFLRVSFHDRRKEAKLPWKHAIYATIWYIGLERNPCIFKEISMTDYFSMTDYLIWKKIWQLASIWCKPRDIFSRISLNGPPRN